MLDTLPLLLKTDFPTIRRGALKTLQVNLGYTCNQSCLHCHVNAGPKRTEQMTRQNIDHVIDFLKRNNITFLDLTGGAPELNPDFRYLVTEASNQKVHIIDRCNLTILLEPGHEDLAEFLAFNKVEVVASLPCYLEENVDSQRGKGVYESSVHALKKLNELGYGKANTGLIINLMYNPTGFYLPPSQHILEQDYKRELKQRYDIVFNNLYTLTNMPIMRFGSTLISKGEFDNYMMTLKTAHQDINLQTVMCRNLISIDWQGFVYDCDFNQILNLPIDYKNNNRTHIGEINAQDIEGNTIVVADHCYGCTAGSGSSCGGALTES